MEVQNLREQHLRQLKMNKFPPRVGIERQHICALTGQLRWQAIHGPRAHYMIDPVVNDEYLSLEEHQSILGEIEAERDEYKRLADEWCDDYTKLENKYESKIAVFSDAYSPNCKHPGCCCVCGHEGKCDKCLR